MKHNGVKSGLELQSVICWELGRERRRRRGGGQILLFFPFMVYLVCQIMQLKYPALPPPLTGSSANSCLRPTHTHKHTLAYTVDTVAPHASKHRRVRWTCAYQRLPTWTCNTSEYYKRSKLLTRRWSYARRVLSGLEHAFTQG